MPWRQFEPIETVRLEIQPLIDACARTRWQLLLNASQQRPLKSRLQGCCKRSQEPTRCIGTSAYDTLTERAVPRLMGSVTERKAFSGLPMNCM